MTDDPGHGTPDADTWPLVLPGAEVHRRSVSEMDNNVYLLLCTSTGERLLIDAADEPETIAELLWETDGEGLAQVLTSHRHWDHHRALAAVVERTGASTLAGAEDADELPVAVDRRLEDGDTVRVGSLLLDVVGLRGHTPGSVALSLTTGGDVARTVIFTGDSLFPGGVGKTTTPEDFTSLIDDVTTRVFDVYPDDTLVLPGHGASTTLGAERPHLQEWRERGW